MTREEVCGMKKRVMALTLVLVMLLGVTAQAAGPAKKPVASPSITFSGTTATCSVMVRGDKSTDKVVMTAKLWNGSTCLKTWTASGTQRANLNKTATVSKGKTYQLTVDYTINGVKQPQKSTTKTCS